VLRADKTNQSSGPLESLGSHCQSPSQLGAGHDACDVENVEIGCVRLNSAES
jgi:hypothetical protein